MRRHAISAALVLAAASLFWGSATRAENVPKKCLGCHDAEKKKVGPAFKDAAAKHKGDKGAADAIVAKMKSGKGHPKVSGSDDELKAAVSAALSK